MNSVKVPQRGIGNIDGEGQTTFKGKYNTRGKNGHTATQCKAQKKSKHNNAVDGRGTIPPKTTRDKKGWRPDCIKEPPKEGDCDTTKNGNPPQADNKPAPAASIGSAGTSSGRTTMDLSSDQLSNLFNGILNCSTGHSNA